MSTTPPNDDDACDVADFLAAGGSFDDGLASTAALVPLAERKAADCERARVALRAAIVALGVAQTTREERAAVARAILDPSVVDGCGWLSVLHPAEWSRTLAALAACGGFSEHGRRLERAVRAAATPMHAEAAVDEKARDRTSVRVSELPLRSSLGAAAAAASGADAALVVPRPWEVRPNGVWKVKTDAEGNQTATHVCRTPVFIASVGDDGSGGGTVHLRWRDGARWIGADVPRSGVLVARDLAALSARGVPASSSSAAGLVEFFDAWLIVNAGRLRSERVCSALGWQFHGDSRAFLWGSTVLGTLVARPTSALVDNFPTVGGYRAAGSFAGWRELHDKVRGLHGFDLALLAACVPPLVRLVPGAPNAIVDFTGITSAGKTTALRLAASVWGLPDDRDPAGILRTWDVTQAWVERAAAAMCDLPTLLDDSTRQEKADTTRAVVYGISQGQGRGRGTITGVQQTATWYTALLSTGEAPLADHLKGHGGAQARVLTIHGSPFGASSPEHGATARLLRAGLVEHHGHLGPSLVRWLLDDTNLALVRAAYARHLEAWSLRAGMDAVAVRRAEVFALFSTAADALAALSDPVVIDTACLDRAWDTGNEDAVEASDTSVAALRIAWAWAVAQQARLDGVASNHAPQGGYIGRAGNNGEPWAVALLPEPLREVLVRARILDVDQVIRRWAERGWILRDTNGKHLDRKVRINGPAPRCHCITAEALLEAGCIDSADLVWGPPPETTASTPPTWPNDAPPPPTDDDRPAWWDR